MKKRNVLKWMVPVALVTAALTPVDMDALNYQQSMITKVMQEIKSTSDFGAKMDAERVDFLNKNNEPRSVELGDWFFNGPYELKNFNETPSIETQPIDFSDAKVWTKRTDWPDDCVHNFQNKKNSSAYYLARKVTATEAQKLTFQLGSDDGFSFYINGKRVAHENLSRGASPNQNKVVVDLNKGENTILFRIFNQGGATGFYFNPEITLATEDLWTKISKEFPEESQFVDAIFPKLGPKLLLSKTPVDLAKNTLQSAFPAKMWNAIAPELDKASNAEAISLVVKYASLKNTMNVCNVQLPLVKVDNILKNIADLEKNYPGQLKDAKGLRLALAPFRNNEGAILNRVKDGDIKSVMDAQRLIEIQKEVAFAYPEVAELNELLVVKRNRSHMGISANYNGHTSIGGFQNIDNEIGKLNVRSAKYTPIYKPKRGYIGDIELHFDAERMLVTGVSEKGRLQVFELAADGSKITEITPKGFTDVDNYEGMYLPNGRIIYTSTATFVGVPCVSGSDYVGNIHIMDADGSNVRRLCYDQDNNWCPVLLEDGRVLFLRWEYTDSAHYFSRILMHMNPDGTGQNEFYGSNSYWPNCMFYARPIPGSTTKFVAVVTGHHTDRPGELYLFDVTKGREETQGVVQQIKPHNMQGSSQGYVLDYLTHGYNPPDRGPYISVTPKKDASWPRFLFPHPLSEKQYLVSAQPGPGQPWGLYLIDTNDNMTLLAQDPNNFYFEPTPLAKTKRPPIIPDHIDLTSKTADVYIQDIYEGTGLPGVPRGSVKSLRVFQYEYSYRNMGGHYSIGNESGWDVRRVIGTVPVNPDGSVRFKIPANTPIAIQPLDEHGGAMQQMRSWFVGMPGEKVQCVGCHERQNQTVRPKKTQAFTQAPVEPEPFYGQKRGFSYNREVQPILNRYCVSCHDGKKSPNIPDFTRTDIDKAGIEGWGGFSGYSYSYWNLMPYVRRNGPEGNYKILIPNEFNPNTSELVQLLQKGHKGVKMDKESWERLYTWIDLNVPFHGTWTEVAEASGRTIPQNFEQRRKEFQKLYAFVDEDIEEKAVGNPYDQTPVTPIDEALPRVKLTAQNWPLTSAQANELQIQYGTETKVVDLGDGQKLTFVRIPAGEFNMGSDKESPQEAPVNTVKIEKPFWMCTTEISLAQYRQFDPTHTNYFYDQHYKDQVRPGYDMDKNPNFPVIRVSWTDANEFCKWLSEKTGQKAALPTEAQWEWAARAGSTTPLWYGEIKDDFSKKANMADAELKKMAIRGVDPVPLNNPNKYWNFLPQVSSVNDGFMLLAPVGSKEANRWGLKDMAGNVSEWCRDDFRPYPYKENKEDVNSPETANKSVRGGSWFDRPYRCTSSYRYNFPAWQKVYNVGFRPIIEE